MSTVIVKLGGAAITDKSAADTLSSNLDYLADGIAQAYKTYFLPNSKSLVLIHGAGSFGHPPAKRYNVKAGWMQATPEFEPSIHVAEKSEEAATRQKQQQDAVKFGMALTRQRVIELHHHVLQRLQDRGQLPVLSVSTYDTVETDQGELTQASGHALIARIKHLLSQGFIPLLFGDAVFDQTWGATILSGDALMHKLATELGGVHRCVFATDVAGIFTKDPKKHADAALMHELLCSAEGGVDDEGDTSSSVDDVTGAMGSKWKWVKRTMAEAPRMKSVIICRTSELSRAMAVASESPVRYGHDASETCNWTTIRH